MVQTGGPRCVERGAQDQRVTTQVRAAGRLLERAAKSATLKMETADEAVGPVAAAALHLPPPGSVQIPKCAAKPPPTAGPPWPLPGPRQSDSIAHLSSLCLRRAVAHSLVRGSMFAADDAGVTMHIADLLRRCVRACVPAAS